MILNNTTDIPNGLVMMAVAHSIQDGVEINEIVVKNKREGYIEGQFGWYFPKERKIVIIVPRVIVNGSLCYRGKYSNLPLGVESRAEFLVSIMAHELRHGYQWQVTKIHLGRDIQSKRWREVDAERYQYGMLNLWRRMVADTERAAASKNS